MSFYIKRKERTSSAWKHGNRYYSLPNLLLYLERLLRMATINTKYDPCATFHSNPHVFTVVHDLITKVKDPLYPEHNKNLYGTVAKGTYWIVSDVDRLRNSIEFIAYVLREHGKAEQHEWQYDPIVLS